MTIEEKKAKKRISLEIDKRIRVNVCARPVAIRHKDGNNSRVGHFHNCEECNHNYVGEPSQRVIGREHETISKAQGYLKKLTKQNSFSRMHKSDRGRESL